VKERDFEETMADIKFQMADDKWKRAMVAHRPSSK
jgi:hypothetical protein